MADSKFCTGCQRGVEDVNAVAWCSDCSELVCKVCSRVHERMFPPHKLIPMKEIQQLSSSLFNLSKNCENHPDQKIVLYCGLHDKIICGSCVPESHQNCKPLISVEKAAKGVKDGTAIFDVDKRMENLSQFSENILSYYETTLADLTKSRNKIKKRVSEIKRTVIAHLEKLEADIYKDVDNKYKHCNETVSRNKDNIHSSADSLSIWKNDLRSLKQHATEIHLFQAVKLLDAKTQQKELEIREIKNATVPILTYHPSELESKLIPDLGIVIVENVPVTMPALDIDKQCQFVTVADNRKFSLTNSFELSKLGDGVSISRGCFIHDDRLLLSQYLKRKLLVCKLDGSHVKVINLNCYPQHITLYDNNLAVVSLAGEGIQSINLTNLQSGRIIKVDGHCYGITSVKNKIWIKSQDYTLTIVDINGKVLNTIQTTFDPCDICANQDDDVYCTDCESDKVFVVTSEGEEREIYSSPDLKEPYGVAIDNHGDVYVAGMESNNIHRISHDGQTHDIVLTADDGVIDPTGLSYNCETGELLVLNKNGNSIAIYKKQ